MASRNLIVHIIGDSTQLTRSLATAETKLARFGSNTTKILGALGLGVAGGLAFAVKSFKEFDEGLDAIRVGTGKTGKGLKELEGNFRSINKAVVSSEEDVGKTVAAVSQRLGQQGEGLEKLSKQLLNVSRITKSDLNEVLDATTRTMGDWAIATDKQSEALDYLFRVSQKTQVPFSNLQRTLVQFGAPLRNLGFDFETATALIGNFEAQGVNTETVMAGLKIGLANIAKEGKPVSETFLSLIEQIKNAKTEGEAFNIAFEVFGKKAGTDLVEAVQQGRFDGLLPLIADLKAGKETIDDATTASNDFGEDWAIVMKGASAAAHDFLKPALEMLAQKFKDLNTAGDETEGGFNRWTEAGKVFASILSGIALWFVAVGTAAGLAAVKVVEAFEAIERKVDALLVKLGLVNEAQRKIAGSTPSSAEGAGGGFSGGGSGGKGGGGASGSSWWNRARRGFHAGGIVTRPTPALIGEAGPEAVIPLHRYNGGGGENVIYVMLDGEVLARATDKQGERKARRNGV